ncbi:MAG: outer membrane lipoprotein [Paraglaciecola sp.]|jgi:outer membrane lipoprotein
MYIKVSMLLAALWLTGCSTLPENIQLPEGTNLVTYPQAASQGEQVQGQMVRWGGVIAKIENKPDATMLELLHYPLRSYGKPVSGDESTGRFRVYVKGFMDPMVYQQGRSMTFTGELKGLEEGLVGEHKYVFPSIESNAYHLWKNIQRVDITGIHMWNHGYGYSWRLRPFHHRAIIRGSNTHHYDNASPAATTKPKPVARPARQKK